MKRLAFLFAASLLICTLQAPLKAVAQEEASLAAFKEGRFTDAAKLASADRTANAQAFAARALLASGMIGDAQPDADLLDRAEAAARAALAIEPNHIEGRLQLAISLSLKARPLSTRQAMRTGYGDTAKELVESVLKDDPDNAYAHGFMSVWHIEVVRRGGAIGSSVMGASVKDGITHYQRAAELLPFDASIHWQYAKALAALNVKKYDAHIDMAIRYATDAPVEDELEKIMAARAEQLKTAMATLTRDEVEDWAAEAL